MDRAKFYASLRARDSGVFGTSLSQSQVSGMETILDEALRRGVVLTHLAYILATAYHETAHTMQPIREYGRGKGRKYGVPAGPFGHVYYGRGYVQLTWLENYAKASQKIGVDFVKEPDRVMEPRLAAAIMFDGMAEGWFTGKKLGDYIIGTKVDYRSARRIINGTDKAAQIAGYAVAFEKALKAAGYIGHRPPAPQPAPPASAEPAPAPNPPKAPDARPEPPQAAKRGLLAAIISIIASIFGRK